MRGLSDLQAPSATADPAPPRTSSPAHPQPETLLPPPPSVVPAGLRPRIFPSLLPASRSPALDLASAQAQPPLDLAVAAAEFVPETPPELLRPGVQQAPRPAGSPSSPVDVPAPAARGDPRRGGWLACFPSVGPTSSSPAAPGGAGRDAIVADDGWQVVSSRRGPRRPPRPAPAPGQRPLPAWMEGRCCRCLALGHRAVICRDPFRCSHCLRPGHRVHGCTNAWRPLSSLLPLRRPATAPPRAPASTSFVPQISARGWPAPPQAQPCSSAAPAVPQAGAASDFRAFPSVPEMQQVAALGSSSAAVVWLAEAHSDSICQVAAEALASAIGARVTDVKVVRQVVWQSGAIAETADAAVTGGDLRRNRRDVRCSNASPASPPSSPTSVLPPVADMCAAAPQPTLSPLRPPGFDTSPLQETPPYFSSGPMRRTPSPRRRTPPSPVQVSRGTPQVPLGMESLFQLQQEAIPAPPPPPPSPPPRPPAPRRKTLAGVAIDREGAAFSLRRSSARLRASGHARVMPIQKEAEKLVCCSLGIVKDGEDVTVAALAELEELFKEEIPGTVLTALRALFKLDDTQAVAVEEAIIAQGGANALDHEGEAAVAAA